MSSLSATAIVYTGPRPVIVPALDAKVPPGVAVLVADEVALELVDEELEEGATGWVLATESADAVTLDELRAMVDRRNRSLVADAAVEDEEEFEPSNPHRHPVKLTKAAAKLGINPADHATQADLEAAIAAASEAVNVNEAGDAGATQE